MSLKNFKIWLLFLFVFCMTVNSVYSQEKLESPETYIIPTSGHISYNIQKYTGLNFITDFLTEKTIKAILKIKTKAKKTDVSLSLYSAFDLFTKKVKSLDISAEKLFVKGIPVDRFDLITRTPIYFKKGKVVIPLQTTSKVEVNLENITNVVNNLPRWKKAFGDLELPVPPFGSTRIAINNFEITVDEDGFLRAGADVRSLENPDSETINVKFTGKLAIKDKKLIIFNLQTQMEDIFTEESEVGKSFSKFLEDLINPVFSFHKFERNGITIDNVNLSFVTNKMLLEINSTLLPEQTEQLEK